MTNEPKSTKKSIDLPPKGDRNADPITGAAGAHPIEAGVGAAVAGAAAGLTAGVMGGPVGAVVGAVVGGVAGGYAGKGIGEWIDPTVDDDALRDNFASRPYFKTGDQFEDFQPVYRMGAEAEQRYSGRPFAEIESDIRAEYENSPPSKSMPWDQDRGAVCDAYERTCEIRKERTGQQPKM